MVSGLALRPGGVPRGPSCFFAMSGVGVEHYRLKDGWAASPSCLTHVQAWEGQTSFMWRPALPRCTSSRPLRSGWSKSIILWNRQRLYHVIHREGRSVGGQTIPPPKKQHCG